MKSWRTVLISIVAITSVVGCVSQNGNISNLTPTESPTNYRKEKTPSATPGGVSGKESIIQTPELLGNQSDDSPNGTLLFVSHEGSEVYAMSPAGDIIHLIHNNREYRGTALSNDAKRAAYWFDGFMYTLDLTTSESVQINEERIGSFQGSHMLWSKDDQKIAFDCIPPDRRNAEICVMDLAKKEYQVITDVRQYGAKPNDMVDLGSWSHSSKQISYVLQLFPLEGRSTNVIQIVDVDTGRTRTILDARKQKEYSRLVYPKISPGGRAMLFQSDIQGAPWVHHIDLMGGYIHQIETSYSVNKYGLSNPVWSPDGKFFFASAVKESSGGRIESTPVLLSLDGSILNELSLVNGRIVQWVTGE